MKKAYLLAFIAGFLFGGDLAFTADIPLSNNDLALATAIDAAYKNSPNPVTANDVKAFMSGQATRNIYIARATNAKFESPLKIAELAFPRPGVAPADIPGWSVIPPDTCRIVNLSSRVEYLENIHPIIGFVVSGGSKQILVRNVAQGLASQGVSNTIPFPLFILHDQITGKQLNEPGLIWSDSLITRQPDKDRQDMLAAIFARVGAFALVPGTNNAADIFSLNGVFSVECGNGSDVPSGVTMLEMYDADDPMMTAPGRLVNISSNGYIGNGDNVMIGGFVVGGTGSITIMIRGLGPMLAQMGVDPAKLMTDPMIDLYSVQSILVENDDWKGQIIVTAAGESLGVIARPATTQDFNILGASGSPTAKDAAMIIRVPPGVYTAIVHGKAPLFGGDPEVGQAMFEIYEYSSAQQQSARLTSILSPR